MAPAPASLVQLWPAAGVSIQSGDLELRWIDDTLLATLADLASRGVHDPAAMPFTVPWTRGTPTEVARRLLSYQWSLREQVGPQLLKLELAVVVGGEPVGVQGLTAHDWPILRAAETGSWLGRGFQCHGIGTRMRALVLHLLFEGLGAREVRSSAFVDNPASNAVSRKVGYQPEGTATVVRDDEEADQNRYRITRSRWREVRRDNETLLGAPIVMAGVDALLRQIDPPTPAD